MLNEMLQPILPGAHLRRKLMAEVRLQLNGVMVGWTCYSVVPAEVVARSPDL
jgi:hypothetical protein